MCVKSEYHCNDISEWEKHHNNNNNCGDTLIRVNKSKKEITRKKTMRRSKYTFSYKGS